MSKADGSIVIDAKLNNDALEKGFERLKTDANSLGIACEKTGDKIKAAFADYDVSANIQNAVAKLEQAQIKLQNATDYFKDAVAMDDDKSAEAWAIRREAAYAQVEAAQRRLTQVIAKEANKQATAEDEVVQRINPIRATLEAVGSVAKNTAKTFAKIAGTSVKGIVSGLKTAFSWVSKMVTGGKSLKQAFGGLGASLKQIAPALLAVRGVIGILRKGVDAYLAQNQQLSDQLSNAWVGLGNILSPIIDRVITLVSSAIAYITKFLNLLGVAGKATMKQITNAGSAASKETDKLKKQIMGFDELNVLNDNESSSSGYDAGSVELPDFSKLMAEQIKAGQWAQAADTLTSKLNDMVSNVDWDGIGAKIGNALDGVISFLAGAITGFDWIALGGYLATSANQIIDAVDWENLGIVLWGQCKILLETVAGFLQKLDVAKLAVSLSDIAIGFMDAISETLIAIDWQTLGEQVATFISSVNWSGVSDALFSGLGAAIASLAEFLWGVVEDAWSNVVAWWKETAYEDGTFTIEGLLDGIWEAIKNIGKWIKDHIYEPFMDGFKNAFGIHSPSTVMEEQGGFLVSGLLNGITEAWGSVKQWFTEALNNIAQTIKETWDGVKKFWNRYIAPVFTKKFWLDLAKTCGNGLISGFEGAINGIISMFEKMINWIVDGLNKISIDIPDWIPGLGGKKFGFNIPEVSFGRVSIPKLAQGAVLPANQPFLAMVGDQKHGTNVEAPLSTIQEAVALVMEDMTNGMMAGFEALLEENQRLRAAVEGIEVGDSTIGQAANRYNQRMAIIRG